MASKLYEPDSRSSHVSFSTKEKVYVWGGLTEKSDELANSIEQFDPYLEVWSQIRTAGMPHPGLEGAACTSYGERIYMYGGRICRGAYTNVLSCLDMKTLTWSQLCPAGTAEGPMGKLGCGMVHFHHDKLAVIGGYGFPSGPTQPGSTFVKSADVRGWSNEVHIFNISQGTQIIVIS